MITSLKVKCSGTRTPVRATSIMPEEKVAPSRTPRLATVMITQKGCRAGADGGIEEVDGVIGDADEEVDDGKRAQKRQRSKYECIHSICICPNGPASADAPRETTSRRDSSLTICNQY